MTQMLMANMELRLRLLPSSLWNMASVTSQWRPRYPSLQWHEYRDGEWATHVPWRHGRLAQSVYTHTLPTEVSLVMWPGGHLCRKGDSNVKRKPALGSALIKRSADFWPKLQNLSRDCEIKSLSSQTSSFTFQDIFEMGVVTLTDEGEKRGWKRNGKAVDPPQYNWTKCPPNMIHLCPLLLPRLFIWHTLWISDHGEKSHTGSQSWNHSQDTKWSCRV